MNIAFRFILMHCVGWMGIAGAAKALANDRGMR